MLILANRSAMPQNESRGTAGFTLIELIIATAISAVVVSILSVCFSFALRVWESTQNQKPDQTLQMVDLLKSQLAEFDPTPIKFTEGPRPLFAGQEMSLSFATSHSVKAISQGVPVIAHYVYDRKSKVLYYSELVLDPYHPKSIQETLGESSAQKKKTIPSYGVDFPEFALTYAGKESKQFAEAWENESELPVEVLIKWKSLDERLHSQVLMVNSPLPIEPPKAVVPGQGGAIIQ